MNRPALQQLRIRRLVVDGDPRRPAVVDADRLGAAIAARLQGATVAPSRLDGMAEAIANAVARELASRATPRTDTPATHSPRRTR